MQKTWQFKDLLTPEEEDEEQDAGDKDDETDIEDVGKELSG